MTGVLLCVTLVFFSYNFQILVVCLFVFIFCDCFPLPLKPLLAKENVCNSLCLESSQVLVSPIFLTLSKDNLSMYPCTGMCSVFNLKSIQSCETIWVLYI